MDLADLADSGLGYANLLYVATVLLQLHNAKDAELTVLLVEEPEAHLHPQMQAVFLQYLREQAQASAGDDTTGPAGRIQVVVTTHSPIIASGIPVENVVVLRSQRIGDAQQGEAASQPAQRTATAAVPVAKLGLSATDARKLGQYLDATKAALLFGTRVILVEGVSEAVLLPVLGKKLYSGKEADSIRRRRAISGLTIVNIGSVDFEPYINLLLGKHDGLRPSARLFDARGLLTNDPEMLIESVALLRATGRTMEVAAACEEAAAALAKSGRRSLRRRRRWASMGGRAPSPIRRGLHLSVSPSRRRLELPGRAGNSLTPSEVQVLECVAFGMSNPAIADRLFVSRRTIETESKPTSRTYSTNSASRPGRS
jgi:hypothetical protein